MLRITVEIVPLGVEARKKTISEIIIINNGLSTNKPEYGNYDIKIKDNRYKNVIKEFCRSNGAVKLTSLALSWLVKNNISTSFKEYLEKYNDEYYT